MENNEMKNEMQTEMNADLEKLIKPEDLEKLNADAEKMVQRMNVSEKQEMDVILDHLSNLGGREQQIAGESLSNLRRPVKDMMGNKNNDIPQNLLKLRTVVNELNPSTIQQKGLKGFVNKLMRKNPLEKYITKYQSVEKNIDEIVKGLLRGQDKLQEDNADLELIKRDAREKIYLLEKQVYFGQQLFELLEEKKHDLDWKNKENVVIEAQEKVIVRTKNMMTMINVLQQSLASVDIIRKNNGKLKEAIRNAIDITKNIAPITATINMALQNQETIITAVETVNRTTEDMIAANAKMLKDNTEKTTKLLENPAISFEKLQQSFNDIYAAIEMQEQSSRRIVENSKEYVDKMEKLNAEIKKKLIDR